MTHYRLFFVCLVVAVTSAFAAASDALAATVRTVPQLGMTDLRPRSVIFAPMDDVLVILNEGGRIDVLDITNIDKPTKLSEILTGASSIAVSSNPDEPHIVSGERDGTLQLWTLNGRAVGEPFEGHQAGVSSVALSPDGQRILSGSWDGTVRLWTLDGKPIGPPFEGHREPVRSVAFSPDGQRIVSGGEDGTVRLWALDGKPIANPIGPPFEGPGGSVWSVAFSPDGQQIVSGGGGGVGLWTLDGKPIGRPFEGHWGVVSSVAFSPDGQRIVSGGKDDSLRLWTLDGQPVGEPLEGHGDTVWSVAFSPDGQRIVSGGGDDGTVRLWTLDGEPIGTPFEGHDDPVHSVAFSPDGQRIVSGGGDGTVRLWALDGGPIGRPFEGHDDPVQSVAFSPGGQRIVSGGEDGTVRLWTHDGRAIGKPLESNLAGMVLSVAFSPDGQRIVSGGAGGLRLWMLDGQTIGKPFVWPGDIVWSVAFSPDGQQIVSGGMDSLQLWTLDGQAIGQPLEGHSNAVSSVAFSTDGRRIISGSYDGTLRLWTLDGQADAKPLAGHREVVWSMAFSPDGRQIASGSEDGGLLLWRLDDQAINESFPRQQGEVSSVAFSPNGQRIVSGQEDGTLRLWTLDGQMVGAPFDGHQGEVSSVSFSPDGRKIASGGEDGTVRLWTLDGEPLGKPFKGHNSWVPSVAFSPTGQQIVSGGDDGTLRLWTTEGQSIGQPFEGHRGGVWSVAFSPDGQRVISGGWDGTLRLWDVTSRDHRRIAGCSTSYVQFISDTDHVFTACDDRWLIVDTRAGRVIGALFPSSEGLISLIPEVGVWAPTEEGRRFVRMVDDDLDILRGSLPVLDDFSVVRQTLLDDWTLRERVTNSLVDLATRVRSLHADLDPTVQLASWPVLFWILAGLFACGIWLLVPWRLTHWSLPKVGTPEPPPWKWLLGVLAWYGWLGGTRRPVEKWLERHRPVLERSCFLDREPVRERSRYSPLLDGPIDAARFDEPSHRLLWIFGSGGSGKSALAFHLAREALVGRRRRPMPILVDEDWEGPLDDHIARLLRPPDADRGPTAKMVQRLGSLGRLCPIVDSLSERTADNAVSRVGESIAGRRFRYLLVTSRDRPPTGQAWESLRVVEARPPNAADLPAFVAIYVDDASKQDELTGRLRQLLGTASRASSPSALFLRFALEQMIEGRDAPAGHIDLVLRYVEASREGKVDIAAEDFRRAACVLALEALRNERLAPTETAYERLLGTLNAAADAMPFMDERRDTVVTPPKTLEHLVSCGVLHKNRINHKLQFTYDPVAEYLAAWHIAQAPAEYAPNIRQRAAAHPHSGLARAMRELRAETVGEPLDT